MAVDWAEYLPDLLISRQEDIQRFERYHNGDHPLAFATAEFREEFGRILESYSDNWCELIVDAVVERLRVVGFRFDFGDDGSESPDEEDEATAADAETWRIWRANGLDTGHRQAIRTSLITSRAYGMAWYPRASGGYPRVTFEHPSEFVAEVDPGDPRRVAAAWKQWIGLDGHGQAVLITPESVTGYRSKSAIETRTVGGRDSRNRAVIWSGDWMVDSEEENPLGLVPVVEMPNRPDLLGRPRSELASVIPNQDAINKLAQDMLIASEYGGFTQKFGTGVEIEVDPETNQPVDQFRPNQKHFWHSEDPQARFGAIPHTPLSNFVTALDNRVNSVASQTRTPPHYLNASADRLSGESIKAAETGLVAKSGEQQEHRDDGFGRLMRFAHLIRGDRERANAADVETLWADAESRTEAQHTDAVIKQYQAGLISWQAALERLNYSPTEIRRMRGQVQRERLERSAFELPDLAESV